MWQLIKGGQRRDGRKLDSRCAAKYEIQFGRMRAHSGHLLDQSEKFQSPRRFQKFREK